MRWDKIVRACVVNERFICVQYLSQDEDDHDVDNGDEPMYGDHIILFDARTLEV